jgi:phosphonate transport system ATP-binding protein
MSNAAEQVIGVEGYCSDTDEELLKIENLSKSFEGRGKVLDNVSLQISSGSSVALLGSNGCGKSTLLRCCINLLEKESGSVNLFGENLSGQKGLKLRKLRGRVGVIWQQHNLAPRLTVLSNVVHGALAWSRGPWLWRHWSAPSAIREEAMYCLEQVGLAHFADKHIEHLSGGESQRVAIARALMQRPQLVLADEPAASLDPHIGEEIMSLLSSVCESRSAALLFVSHDIDQARRYAHRLVGLKKGRLVFHKPTIAVTDSELETLYA